MKQLEINYANDVFLSKELDFNFKSEDVSVVLSFITNKTKMNFLAASTVSSMRCTVIGKQLSLGAFMQNIDKSLNATWRKMRYNGSLYFELFQTEEQKRSDEKKRLESEKRADENRRLQMKDVLDEVNRMKNSPSSGAFGNFLKKFTDSNLEFVIDSALDPPDTISANDQSHFHKHFFYSTSIKSLDMNLQNSLHRLLISEGYKNVAPNMQIGLIGAAGSIRLGVVEPDGKDIWVSPRVSAGRASEIDFDQRENDYDDRVARLLKEGQLVDIRLMPAELKQKIVAIPSGLKQGYLTEILEIMVQQIGIRLVSDDFLNSRVTRYVPVFKKQQYTLTELLQRIAMTFARRITYANGALHLETITRGLDLALEPPYEVTKRLDTLCDTKIKSNEEDFYLIGKCSMAQLRCIVSKHPIMPIKGGILHRIIKNYEYFKLLSSLDNYQKQISMTSDGLPRNKFTIYQKKIFDRLLSKNLPSSVFTNEAIKPLRFYLRKKKVPDAVKTSTANFLIVITGSGNPLPVRRFSLRSLPDQTIK